MKYTLLINQKQAISLNLTNINQLFILDIISTAPTWAKTKILENNEVYYWVARQKIIEELPILNLKSDSVYRHLKRLKANGFIDYEKKNKKDLVRLTQKGKSLFTSTMSEVNPNYYVGSKSEKNSEVNPTYNKTILNKNTLSKSKKSIKTKLLNDFSLKEKTVKKLKEEGYSEEQINKTIISFKDYWIEGDGRGKKKINWQSTFRNWVRRSKPWNKTNNTDFKKKAEIERENEEWLKEQRKLGRFQNA